MYLLVERLELVDGELVLRNLAVAFEQLATQLLLLLLLPPVVLHALGVELG